MCVCVCKIYLLLSFTIHLTCFTLCQFSIIHDFTLILFADGYDALESFDINVG